MINIKTLSQAFTPVFQRLAAPSIVLACEMCMSASAAEAITSYAWTGVNIVGYANGGAGFQFSPTANIAVTSLGYGGTDLTINLNPYTVTLWNAAGVQLASATISPSSSLHNWSRYEPISAVTLTLGNTYYLSGAAVSSGLWVGEVILSSGPDRNGTFTAGPEINYMSGATGTNGAGIFPNSLQPNYALLIGPNFQYGVVPEPAMATFAGLALLLLAIRSRKS